MPAQNLAMAYSKQKDAERRRKMWIGGIVQPESYDDEETKYQYPDYQEPSHLNQESEDFSEGGEVPHMYAQGGMVEHGEEGREHPYGHEEEMDDEMEVGREKRSSLALALKHSRRFL